MILAPTYIPPTISASRLKAIGGEKGEPGCERKLAGHYLFGMKQSGSAALERGSALHKTAEIYQDTGEVLDPEGEVGTIFQTGCHLLGACGKLLVEWEHEGNLPDGSPYIAYIDGHSPHGGQTSCVVVQDLKTTSNSKYALTGDEDEDINDPVNAIVGGDSKYSLLRDLQAMFYAWILLCDPHWCCPPLPSDEHYGPKHWQWWVPFDRNAKSARLRWIYFMTKGNARAWEATTFATAAQAEQFMTDNIMPLVDKINALHQWHHANPNVTLDEIDRNFNACGRRGRWCGVYERDACNFEALGTPALDLVQLKVRPKMTPQERLAALKNRNAGGAAAATTEPAPKAEAAPAPEHTPEVAPVAPTASPEAASSAAESTGSSEADVAAPKRGRGRPPKATPGAGINPPEVVEALAKLTPTLNELPAAPAVAAPAVHQMAELGLGVFTTEQIVDFLVFRGYTVGLTRGAAAAQ